MKKQDLQLKLKESSALRLLRTACLLASALIFASLLLPLACFADAFAPISASSFSSLSASAQLWIVFGGGVLSSLTPCVYPLIPITLALFGANSEIPRSRAFLLSVLYVLGIAATYTTLGLISASTGMLFGGFLGNPIVVVVACLVLILLSLCCLDVLPLRVGQAIQLWANQIGGKGIAGSFLMGAVSGIIAAPCVGPVLVVILGLATASQNFLWGGALLFTYSIGMGLLFILLGTFSGLISRIPRSGNWLLWVKLLLGATILTIAVYLSSSFRAPFGVGLNPIDRFYILSFLIILGLAVALVAFKLEIKLLRFVSALFIAFSTYELIATPEHIEISSSTATTTPREELKWATSIEEAVKAAASQQTIAMVDLFAKWCAACKELDAVTFPAPEVHDILKKLSLGRVDFTTDNDVTEKIQEDYNVIGLPCILFLDINGKEIPDSRVNGFLEPAEFAAHLEKVLASIH